MEDKQNPFNFGKAKSSSNFSLNLIMGNLEVSHLWQIPYFIFKNSNNFKWLPWFSKIVTSQNRTIHGNGTEILERGCCCQKTPKAQASESWVEFALASIEDQTVLINKQFQNRWVKGIGAAAAGFMWIIIKERKWEWTTSCEQCHYSWFRVSSYFFLLK